MTVRRLAVASFAASFSAILLELALVRVFGLVLFASFTHLALAVALLGIAAGAVAQHMVPRLVPAHALGERLSAVAMGQALLSLLAIWAATAIPLTQRSDAPVVSFVLQRLRLEWELVDPIAFAVLLPLLVLPFAAVGLFFAALFQHRREQVGLLYGADLAGAAVGALVLFPLLHQLAPPDVVFVSTAAAAGASALLAQGSGQRVLGWASSGLALGCAALAVAAGSGQNLLRVQYPAGFSDQYVVLERWTPVARLAVHESPKETRILLDNTSSSQVVLTRPEAATLARDLGRSLAFRMHDPPARVAVLAASAGPDVAVAQHLGFTGVHAIDVAPEIGDLILERYPNAPINPFRDGGTRRIVLDARAAVLHADAPYDVIQMIHANLHGAGGRLAQAWSPGLLGTVEAFDTWLSRLSDDGTVSFARGSNTVNMVRSAAEAVRARGNEEPWRNIAFVEGPSPVVLVKRRPFTDDERTRLHRILAGFPRYHLVVDPGQDPSPEALEALFGGVAMTDDRPYTDTPGAVVRAWSDAGGRLVRGDVAAVRTEEIVYYLMIVESAFVAVAALLLFWLPWRVDQRRQAPTSGAWILLGYAACLGYGYLAVELALISRFVLTIGHPVLAMTTVVTAMLLASGLGSVSLQWLPPGVLVRRVALLASALGVALTALSAPLLLHLALGAPVELRIGLCAVVVAIPAIPMGMALPAALATLSPAGARLIPWAWAINGLFSVIAALGTAVIARLAGYSAALSVAVFAYLIAAALSERLHRVGAP